MNPFENMISIENLFHSWDQFKRGKRKRKEMQRFERYLEDHLFSLHDELKTASYQHGPYQRFHVFDPKKRHISKATIKDRLVHQVLYSALVHLFDTKFITHSFSCRLGKGTHCGVRQLHKFIRKASLNNTRPCHVLKMDIKRFFDQIDHNILKTLIRRQLRDTQILSLIDKIIDSFHYTANNEKKIGVPLGNVTSQVFANIYLHELDIFVKHILKETYYLRYCDDFVIISHNPIHLKKLIAPIGQFLKEHLHLELHPQKTSLRKLSQGIDFLGYITFFTHGLLRTKTKQRVKKRLALSYQRFLQGQESAFTLNQRLQSYLGILSHANQYALSIALKNAYSVKNLTAKGGLK